MARLSGKTAAITGGAGGIGAAIARLFAEQGATLALLDLNGDGAAENASALNGAGHYGGAVDVGEEASVASAFATAAEAVGEIDILVNTAAIAGAAPVEEMAVADWDDMIRINLRGTFLCCRAVIPAMRQRKWGRIVNFASEVAHRGNPGLSHYAASKAAVIAFSKCLALEAVGDGVCVNTLSPGPTDTSMLAGIEEEVIDKLVNDLMPIGRLGKTEEIAAAALFLASDDASFCVGTTLNVNGGTYLH
ncbi:MAG: 3-oxoacyl-[acyl-carrier-protein] reductase FabG [Alphaproteobacteria bacterium MarineAlpha10_Bin2]|nr:MAG: 3-oxoacyl-[acyl-carrier-protein] reductase FabG [Alphaproteobacteria bacterium MarineAlpha10_Bin2]